MPIREVNRSLGFDLPEDGDWNTIAGLCIGVAGHIPVAGEKIMLPSGVVLEVVDASARRIRSVRIRRENQSPEPL
jgi:putative hemolysin